MNSVSDAPASSDLLKQLADIRGLGPVSWWPLAVGWWALIAFIILSIVIAVTLYIRRRKWRQSWQADAANMLATLDAKLNDANAQKAAAALSMTLRRIAMQKYSRAVCAGLEGQAWLQWLHAHDPKGFDWTKDGQLLIDAPYAPPQRQVQAEAVKRLVQAAQKWVQ